MHIFIAHAIFRVKRLLQSHVVVGVKNMMEQNLPNAHLIIIEVKFVKMLFFG